MEAQTDLSPEYIQELIDTKIIENNHEYWEKIKVFLTTLKQLEGLSAPQEQEENKKLLQSIRAALENIIQEKNESLQAEVDGQIEELLKSRQHYIDALETRIEEIEENPRVMAIIKTRAESFNSQEEVRKKGMELEKEQKTILKTVGEYLPEIHKKHSRVFAIIQEVTGQGEISVSYRQIEELGTRGKKGGLNPETQVKLREFIQGLKDLLIRKIIERKKPGGTGRDVNDLADIIPWWGRRNKGGMNDPRAQEYIRQWNFVSGGSQRQALESLREKGDKEAQRALVEIEILRAEREILEGIRGSQKSSRKGEDPLLDAISGRLSAPPASPEKKEKSLELSEAELKQGWLPIYDGMGKPIGAVQLEKRGKGFKVLAKRGETEELGGIGGRTDFPADINTSGFPKILKRAIKVYEDKWLIIKGESFELYHTEPSSPPAH